MEHHNIHASSPLMIIASFAISIALNITAKLIALYTTVTHIPPFIIESLQCLSYAGSFGLFILAIYKYKKEKRKKKQD